MLRLRLKIYYKTVVFLFYTMLIIETARSTLEQSDKEMRPATAYFCDHNSGNISLYLSRACKHGPHHTQRPHSPAWACSHRASCAASSPAAQRMTSVITDHVPLITWHSAQVAIRHYHVQFTKAGRPSHLPHAGQPVGAPSSRTSTRRHSGHRSNACGASSFVKCFAK